MFEDTKGDGYKSRTAWAGAGNAVLFVDPTNSNALTQTNQFVFTDWDPTATSDMQALKDVFDTNHDGKLDAGDADFGLFKLLVTNADGTTSVETLAQAGITSINLTENDNTQTLSDGTVIGGETTYTKSGGGTGTVATVQFATGSAEYAVTTTTTKNATTGAVTVDNKALNSAGSLTTETTSTTSADGSSETIDYDLNGDGQIDKIQTIATTTSGTTTTQTITDETKGGVLLDQTVTATTTSGGTTTATISRDMNGAISSGVDVLTQKEVDTTTGGLTTVSLTDLNPDGSKKHQVVTTPSNGGLTQVEQQDLDGNGTFDLTTMTTTTVNGTTGARTTTVTDTNQDGSKRDAMTTVISADSTSKTVTKDIDGNGTTDLTTATTITGNATSSVVAGVTGTVMKTVDTSQSGAFIDATVSFVSQDGLTKVTQIDNNSAGNATTPTFDRTTTDITTVDASGTRTETVTDKSTAGTFLDQTITIRAADGITRTTKIDTTGTQTSGNDVFNEVDTVSVSTTDKSVTETDTTYTMGGAQIARTITTTSADGMTSTVTSNVDGKIDETTKEVKANQSGGGTVVTTTHAANNGTVFDTTTRTTSADGLDIATTTNVGGNAISIDDSTVVNADNSRTETVTTKSSGGTLESRIVTATSADRQTKTITSDFNGDGQIDQIETIAEQANGSTVDTVNTYEPNGVSGAPGTLVHQTITTTSATGLSTTTTVQLDGHVDKRVADVTVLNADGSRTDTVTDTAKNGLQFGQTVTKTSGNGLSVTTTRNEDGKVDFTTTDVTVLNADGSRTETVTRNDESGAVITSTATKTSANGLSRDTEIQESAAGTPEVNDVEIAYQKTINSDGGTTETLTTTNLTTGTLRNQSITTTAANGLSGTVKTDSTGDAYFDEIRTWATQTNGNATVSDVHYNQDGSESSGTYSSTSANGLSVTSQTDRNGDGTWDSTTTDVTVINADGSRTETVSHYLGAMATAGSTTGGTLYDSSVTTTSANGTSTNSIKKLGTTTIGTSASTIVYNANGTRVTTATSSSSDGTVRQKTVTTVNAEAMKTTIQSNSYAAVASSSTETITEASTGTVTDQTIFYNATGGKVAATTVTKTANGLTTTETFDQNGDGTTDETEKTVTGYSQTDASQTTTFTDTISGTLDTITGGYAETVTVKTVSAANGLSKTVTETGMNGQDSIAHNATKTTLINSDGSTTTTDAETVGTATDTGVVIEERRGLSVTTEVDTQGTGTYDRVDIRTTNLDNSTTETATNLNGDGSVGEALTSTLSADGKTFTETDKLVQRVETDLSISRTTAANGNVTTVTRHTDGTNLLNTITTVVSANGFTKTTQFDTNGDGIIDETRSDTTVLNADGSQTETIIDTDQSGNQIHKLVTTTPENGLSASTTTSGSGSALETASVGFVFNNDGSTTKTTTAKDASNHLIFNRVVTTSADAKTVTTSWDVNGDGKTDVTETDSTASSGLETITDTFINADGTTQSKTVKTVSANGRITRIAYESATGSVNVLETTLVSADGSGSYSWTQEDGSGTVLLRANHLIDTNSVDHVDLWIGSTETKLAISTAQEAEDLSEVQALYKVVLGRTMNAAESQTWLQYVDSKGLNTGSIATMLLGSQEFATVNGLSSIRDKIDTMYQNAFDRAPTYKELTYWTTEINSKAIGFPTLALYLSQIANPSSTTDLFGQAQSAAAPNEITSVNATAGTTTESWYNPATGQLSHQVVLTTSTGAEKSAVSYNELGQKVDVITFDASGNELESDQLDANTGAVLSAQIYNGGDVASLSNVPITLSNTVTSATINGSGNDIQDDSTGSLTINGSNDILRSPAGANVTIGAGSTGTDIMAKSGTFTAASGDSMKIEGTNDLAIVNSATLTIDGGLTTTIRGSSDAINAGSGDKLQISGTNDTVTATNSTIIFGGTHTGDTVSGTGNTVTYQSGSFDLTGSQAFASGDNIVADQALATADVIGAAAADQGFAEARAAYGGGAGSRVPQSEGAVWGSKVITWSLADASGPDAGVFSGFMGTSELAAVKGAFAAWAKVSGLTFVQVADGTQADIRLGYGSFDTQTSGVLGYTSYSSTDGRMNAGTVIRVEDPSETALTSYGRAAGIYAGTQATFEQVLLHEIGHALGLADDSDPASVMNYAATGANRKLDRNDVAGIRALYDHQSRQAPGSLADLLGPSTGDLIGSALSQGMVSMPEGNSGPATGSAYDPSILRSDFGFESSFASSLGASNVGALATATLNRNTLSTATGNAHSFA
ncbi:MAG: matrixin family metalloprotease [Paracoccaceae bacterium]|nr:matrixin family metalloprotease [Paracoccaceae bacterium]